MKRSLPISFVLFMMYSCGKAQKVVFAITADMLAFYNDRLELSAEPGMFEAMSGADSQRVQTAGFGLI